MYFVRALKTAACVIKLVFAIHCFQNHAKYHTATISVLKQVFTHCVNTYFKNEKTIPYLVKIHVELDFYLHILVYIFTQPTFNAKH